MWYFSASLSGSGSFVFAVRWYRDVLTAGTGCSPPGLVRRVLLPLLM